MKEEIKEILKDNGELMVRYKDNSFECFDTLPKNVVDYITNLQEERDMFKSRNEKALDKLYCYGEVFDRKILQDFQKEMINILGDDKDVKD